jgi:hypothetical protein
MNTHEIERIAAALHQLRPDWPTKQLATLLALPVMSNRPRRDVCVALAWVACESGTATPYRVLESGPWWKAAAIEGRTSSFTPYDHGGACGICDQPEDRCKANPFGEHDYEPKPRVIADRVPAGDDNDIVTGLRDRLTKAQHTDIEPLEARA